MKKLLIIFKLIKTVKFSFKIPAKNPFLFYDFQEIFNVIKIKDFEKLNFRNEINCFILILNLLNIHFWMGRFKFSYCYTYIKFISPRIIYTFSDNDILFYEFKKFFPKIIFYSFQNGSRSISQDIFEYKKGKDLNCDLIFTHNDYIAKEYQKIIKTKTMTIGSYFSNINPKVNTKKKDIIFVSQFNERKDFYFKNYKDKIITWDNYYYPEQIIVPLLDEFCYRNKISLNICARFHSNKAEKFFYESKILKANMTFMDKQEYINSYKIIDQSKMLVFIDSTLGYESISRHNKTVALSVRSKFVDDESFDFGWPINFEKKGFFWTNELDEEEILKLLYQNYLMTDEDWLNKNKNFIKKVMHVENSVSKINSLFL